MIVSYIVAGTPVAVALIANYNKLKEIKKTAGEIHVLVNSRMEEVTKELSLVKLMLDAKTISADTAAHAAAKEIGGLNAQIASQQA